MLYAFTDAGDGYYQLEVPIGDALPEWTNGLIPCDLRELPIDPKEVIRAEIDQILSVAGVAQDWHLDAMLAGMVALAATQGLMESELYEANPGYKQVRDAVERIKTLKAQL